MLLRIVKYHSLRIVALVVALSLLHVAAQARILSPNPVTTRAQLTTAVGAAVAGDTIIVSANTEAGQNGRYNLTASWNAGALNVRAGVAIIGIGAQPVVFNLASGGRLFDIQGSNNPEHITRIENITMLNGVNNWLNGGAINAVASGGNTPRLVLDNVNVTTRVGDRGGAIFANGAEITIKNSNFDDCHAQNGAVIYMINSDIRISDSRIGNNGTSDGGGSTQQGGAFFVQGGTLLVERSQIFNNSTGGQGQGGAVYMTGGATVTFEYCDIVGNSSIGGGAGFFMAGNNNTLNLSFSTVAGNANVGWGPGAITGGAANTVNINNSIVSGNSNASGGGGGNNNDVNAPNMNLDNTVIGNDLIVSTDPNADCQPNCSIPNAFDPNDIEICDSTGTTVSPPVYIPGEGEVEIGSGGGSTTTLTLTVSSRIVCTRDSVRFTINQTNVQNIRLWRVSSTGAKIQQIGGPWSATVTNIWIRHQNSPIEFYMVEGQNQDGNNDIVQTEIVEIMFLPTLESWRIDHVSNIPIDP
jgi:hypothetical protein